MKRVLALLFMELTLLAFGGIGCAAGEETAEEMIETIVDNEAEERDLAEGYINQVMYQGRESSKTRGQYLLGSTLSGIDRTLYDYLCQDVKETAAGERPSTVYVYPIDTFQPQLIFTATELGIETISADGTLTDEAEEAIRSILYSYHAASIVRAVVADCPFDLYWYNKSSSGGCRVAVSFTETVRTSDGVETVTLGGYIKFSMAVAQEYAAGTYAVDTSYGQAVSAAAENARHIVETYEGLPDYERLLAYKNAICDLTSYNDEAAKNRETPYGNPWQLVWVFDGNEETNVVCEGYAKAFQYLNELSASAVTVISPQGTINGAPHMWNVVAMDNGRKYLVDVTHCDTGGAGYPDRLFLVGYSSGSVKDGYRMATGHTYAYTANQYPEEALTISSWNYLQSVPDTPVCAFSTDIGYMGYQLAVRLNEDADGILILESGEELPCQGRDVLIPLTQTGQQSFTIAAVRDGLVSDFGEMVTIQVAEIGGAALNLPAGLQIIEEMAFQGVNAAKVIIPASVAEIGVAAFADNESLLLAEIGDAVLGEGAFDRCPNLICCFEYADRGFSEGRRFVVKWTPDPDTAPET